jgi:hypothetical protein
MDHEKDGVKYKAGDSIEVTKEEYEFIMSYYADSRKELVQKYYEQEEVFEKVKKVRK